MKKTALEIRDYNIHPRRIGEFDTEHRGDIDFSGEVSLTKQADAEAADINYIMKRYEKTGQLPEMIRAEPRYGDFSDAPSFQEALHIVAQAEEQFMALDARVRAEFENDPGRMLEFIDSLNHDPEKNRKLVEKGLAVPVEPSVDHQLLALQEIAKNTKPKANSTVSND